MTLYKATAVLAILGEFFEYNTVFLKMKKKGRVTLFRISLKMNFPLESSSSKPDSGYSPLIK